MSLVTEVVMADWHWECSCGHRYRGGCGCSYIYTFKKRDLHSKYLLIQKGNTRMTLPTVTPLIDDTFPA